MNIYIYNNDNSEQSIRQMETLISFIHDGRIIVDSMWENIFKEKFIRSVEFMSYSKFLKENKKNKKKVIYLNILDGYYLLKSKKKNQLSLTFRPRGLLPEESYYKNKSIIRKIILNYIERKVISNTASFIYLNEPQKEHYQKKYQKNKQIQNNYYILPNVKEIKNIEENKDKTIPSIVYLGGFSKWQNIELIFELISKIINNYKFNCNFTILTFEENFSKAEELAKSYDIGNQLVLKYVVPKDVDKELSKHDIGIIIRDNDIINKTSSPFKIMDYIANGLAVIATSNISWQIMEILDANFYINLFYDDGKIRYSEANLKRFLHNNLTKNNKEKIKINYSNYLNQIDEKGLKMSKYN